MQSPSQTPRQTHFPLIDGYPFAQARGDLRGACAAGVFSRLKDLLGSPDSGLEYSVQGASDALGRPALRLQARGILELTCQRCLGSLAFPLAVDAMLVLARNEAEIEAQPVEPDSPDRIVGDKEMDVGALLEDEILLAIPFAPRHEHCSGTQDGKGAEKSSPFAQLRGLLKTGGRAGN